jgi:toxin ParE1/3/4
MGDYRITAIADEDLHDIWMFIARDDPDVATRFLDKLDKTFHLLADSSLLGRDRSADAKIAGIRTFPVGNYVIIYRAEEVRTGIAILRVIHAARDVGNFIE